LPGGHGRAAACALRSRHAAWHAWRACVRALASACANEQACVRAGRTRVSAPMWRSEPSPGADVRGGEPGPGADVGRGAPPFRIPERVYLLHVPHGSADRSRMQGGTLCGRPSGYP
jgi:hypothetical protein